VNPSGGLVGGDHLAIQTSIGRDAHALISTPSANRIYRTVGEAAEQSVELRLEPGAVLEWLPDPTIPFAGSRYRQRVDIRMASGSALIYWDVLAAGRIAREERWRFAEVSNELRITAPDGAAVVERYRIGAEAGGVGLADGWNYVASLYVIADRLDGERRARLAEQLADAADSQSGLLAGVSEPAIAGLSVRVLAKSAVELRDYLEGIWGAARAELLNRSAPALRRY